MRSFSFKTSADFSESLDLEKRKRKLREIKALGERLLADQCEQEAFFCRRGPAKALHQRDRETRKFQERNNEIRVCGSLLK